MLCIEDWWPLAALLGLVGSPQPHCMPVVYYSSMELIMASRILGLTYSYFDGSDSSRKSVAYIQGLHPPPGGPHGLLFCAPATSSLDGLTDFINKDLDVYGRQTIKLPVRVSTELF
jgi:hypothetical protein